MQKNNIKIISLTITLIFLFFSKIIILDSIHCPDCLYIDRFQDYYMSPVKMIFMFEGILFILMTWPAIMTAIFIKFLLAYIPIYYILKLSKLNDSFKYGVVFIFIILFSFFQNFIYNNYSPSALKEKEELMRKKIEFNLIGLKTKENILNYIKSDKNYLETTCFIEKLRSNGSKIDFINVPEINGYLKDSNKTLFCEINENIDENFIQKFWKPDTVTYLNKNLEKISKSNNNLYDCIFIFKNHTSHQICFKDGIIKRLDSTFSNNWIVDQYNLNISYALDNKVYITSYCDDDEPLYGKCTREIDPIKLYE